MNFKNLAVIIFASSFFACTDQSADFVLCSADIQDEAIKVNPDVSVTELTKPNFLIFFVDDLAIEDSGFMHSDIEGRFMPKINQIAEDGLVFSNFHTTSPICTPSRYTLLTGKHASRAQNSKFLERVAREGAALPAFNTYITAHESTLPNALQSLGYKTGFMGKDHVVDKPDFRPVERVDDLNSDIARRLELNQRIVSEYIENIGFDKADRVFPTNPVELPITELHAHNLDWVVDGALEFIEDNKDENFFLYVALTIPHGPLGEDKAWNADRRITPWGILEQAPDVMPNKSTLTSRLPSNSSRGEENFLWLDDAFNAVISKLEDSAILDNTIVFFISDHGQTAKASIYDAGTRTAIYISGKGLASGRSNALIQNIDIMPTVLELAGMDQVDIDSLGIDGRSFVDVLIGDKNEFRNEAFFDLGYTRGVLKDNWKYVALRHTDYIKNLDNPNNLPLRHWGERPGGHIDLESKIEARYPNYFDADQLYNLKQDSCEQTNLAGNSESESTINDLKRLLSDFSESLEGGFGEI